MLLRCGPGVVLRYALQPAHQEAALRQKRGDLDDIAERGVRLVDVAVEIFGRGALGLRSPFSAYNSSRARGFRERDKRDLERGLLGGYEVPGSECALKSRARVALRLTNTRSHTWRSVSRHALHDVDPVASRHRTKCQALAAFLSTR